MVKKKKKKKKTPANAGDVRDSGSSLGQKDPLEEGKAALTSILENLMDSRALWTTVHRVTKIQTRIFEVFEVA